MRTRTAVYKPPSPIGFLNGSGFPRIVHGLTDAEARVVWSALALPGASERERLEGSGLPSSTYHATRRRAYTEGWVRDRFVPDPVAVGRPIASIVLGRPYAEEIPRIGSRWAGAEGNVLLWTGTPMVLGVFFHTQPSEARRAIARLADPARLRDVVSITVDLNEARIPVYFDFEGAWARLAGLPVSPSYPFGLGYGAGRRFSDTPQRPLPDRWRAPAAELLERPFAGVGAGLLRWLGLGDLDRRQRDLVEHGYLRPRTFLDPAATPGYRDRRIDQLILVTGEMRDLADPTVVLSELRTVHHASPFLFASEGPRVILGLLGHTGGPAPPGNETDLPSAPMGPVLRETLARHLQRVDVYREEASALRILVDHRYARLLAPSHPEASPTAPSRRKARAGA